MKREFPFIVVGLSHHHANIDLRSQYNLSDSQLQSLLVDAKERNIQDFVVINTCNRTELYGWVHSEQVLIDLLFRHTEGKRETFESIAYCYKDTAAFAHIFRVGAGLESQILGDFEVIGQLKKSFYRSKKLGLVNGEMERLVNAVIQCSKRIKTETKISSGATSVAFASVQYILNTIENISNKKIVLFGTGKIGRNTCENLVKHTQNEHIILINRTEERARAVADKFPVKVKPYGDLTAEIRDTDVLIVATGAQHPTINKEVIYNTKPLLVLDLSVPKNVASEVAEMEMVKLVHLDTLSQITDATLDKRKQYIPKAEVIIEEVKSEFMEWLSHRKYAPTLKAFKDKIAQTHLENENEKIFLEKQNHQLAQKLTGQVAYYLKENPQKAAHAIQILQDVFQLQPTTEP